MTQNRTPSPAEVEQADREAAASFYNAHLSRPGEVPVADHMRAGKIDESPLIQAFARHRVGAQAALDWFSDQPCLSLEYHSPVYGDIEEEAFYRFAIDLMQTTLATQEDPIPDRAASGDNQSPRDPDAIEAERFVAQNWNGEIGNFAIKAIQHGRALSKEAGDVGGE